MSQHLAASAQSDEALWLKQCEKNFACSHRYCQLMFVGRQAGGRAGRQAVSLLISHSVQNPKFSYTIINLPVHCTSESKIKSDPVKNSARFKSHVVS